jgi:hypothetical protein
MSKVNVNALPSSVIFSQGKREVTVGRNHLPLISGVISAVYTANSGVGALGIARTKAFTSLAIPAGYKGRDNLLDCAKDSAQLAAGKKLIQKSGMVFTGSDDYRMIAEAIVDFVNKSKDFKKADVKKTKTGMKVNKKSNKLKKFRITEDGKLSRLGRGKPSPFWTIVQAPETAQDSDAFGEDGKILKDFKVVQRATDKAIRVKTSRKSAKSEDILALQAEVKELRETLTEILDVVKGNAKLLESLKKAPKVKKAKVPSKLSEIVEKMPKVPTEAKKAKEDAKVAAMADLSSISEEFGNIVTQL